MLLLSAERLYHGRGMKIAAPTCTFPPYRGGIGNIAFYEAEALAGQGHDVTVLTPRYGNGSGQAETAASRPFAIRYLRPLFATGNAAICPGLPRALRGADAILLHYPFFGGAELVLASRLLSRRRRERQTLVLQYHMDVVGHGLKRRLFAAHTRWLMPAILKSADKVAFSSFDYASHSNASWFIARYPDKCVEVPYGVDPNRFYREATIAKQPKSLLFVGGLDAAHYFKGLENLLRALAPLVAQDGQIVLTVVGKGGLLGRYQALCRELDLTQNVRFLTDCDDHALRRQYTAASATVLPSVDKSEAFGLVLLESMACGTAIVATDLPGVRTLVQDGANGCLVRSPAATPASGAAPYALEDLRHALSRILTDPADAVRMGEQGLRLARDKYTWQRVAHQLLAGLA